MSYLNEKQHHHQQQQLNEINDEKLKRNSNLTVNSFGTEYEQNYYQSHHSHHKTNNNNNNNKNHSHSNRNKTSEKQRKNKIASSRVLKSTFSYFSKL